MAEPLSERGLDLLFRNARSYNGYLDKPVGEDDLRRIWDLMKFGPTSANLFPARIIWCVSQDAKDKLSKLVSGNNEDKVRKAPVTAIIGMDMEFYEHAPRLFPVADARSWFMGADGQPNAAAVAATAFRNSSLQGAYFIFAARALGLDTGPMSGFDNDAVDAAFFAGTTFKSNFISTLGYGDPATIFDRLPRPAFEEFTKIA
ncbi:MULTISPECIES: malonic semialdehyde reductase [unclassified Sphingomonas]|uniref:malonic semialdehyde reductase n=1 Tax=unclassified Sphingomonas TaxID=196159 RepID=UPI0006F355D2|nr:MULTISPECIES: malonic semialdehyde reductase [unclassified Sphingomonas]KQX20822.1 malonic semialdehyde reductase [Sphingomonas sp. Root1294]KQY68668.1 malonic semialdehyde reductase [Sphingomonas sp. Root50]KRB88073.1 malonic semialdehyde reductase [Sphingomonas sp. Root720]